MRSLLIAALALGVSGGVALAQSNDNGFATRSVTGLGLTGEPSAQGTPVPNSAAGAVGAPTAGNGGVAGPVGSGVVSGSPGIGLGAPPPAAGGGTFGAPSPRR